MEWLKKALAAHATAQAVVAALIGIILFVGAGWGYVSMIATDVEVAHALNKHDHGNEEDSTRLGVPHPGLTDRVTAIETVQTQHAAITAAQGEEVRELWKRMTRWAAADRETDSRLQKAAGDFYADEFDRIMMQPKMAPSRAFLEALHQVWHSRPRR